MLGRRSQWRLRDGENSSKESGAGLSPKEQKPPEPGDPDYSPHGKGAQGGRRPDGRAPGFKGAGPHR